MSDGSTHKNKPYGMLITCGKFYAFRLKCTLLELGRYANRLVPFLSGHLKCFQKVFF